MLTASDIKDLEHKHKNSVEYVMEEGIEFRRAYEGARAYITMNARKETSFLDEYDARDESLRLIDAYVNQLDVPVLGYEDDLARLRKDLKAEIVDYKAISELMSDEGIGKEVTEIRINGYNSIIYERKGKTYLWPKVFENSQELEKVLNKLIGDDKRLSRAQPFINSSTLEGHRINATDKSISNNGDYTAVIRKFNPGDEKLEITDIIEFRTLSDNMAKLLDIIPKGRFSFLTVGGTGSGKTVTNEIIINGMRPMDRQIYIENPCELSPGVHGVGFVLDNDEEVESFCGQIIKRGMGVSLSPDAPPHFYDRMVLVVPERFVDDVRDLLEDNFGEDIILDVYDQYGAINDYIQMLSNSDLKEPSAKDPTPNNLVENALRQTPIWIVVGEARSDQEFVVLLKAAQTGHCVVTTFHAQDPEDAIRRYLMAYLAAAPSVPMDLVMENICSSFDFIINVEKLHDGSRRMMYITEIVGVDANSKPVLNDIYKFEVDRVDEEGTIIGSHKRVGKLSSKAVAQMRKMGIPDISYEMFTTDPSPNEKETYNAKPYM